MLEDPSDVRNKGSTVLSLYAALNQRIHSGNGNGGMQLSTHTLLLACLLYGEPQDCLMTGSSAVQEVEKISCSVGNAIPRDPYRAASLSDPTESCETKHRLCCACKDTPVLVAVTAVSEVNSGDCSMIMTTCPTNI